MNQSANEIWARGSNSTSVQTFIRENGTSIYSRPEWNPTAVVHLFVAIPGSLLNGLVLLAFLRDPQLRTPFNLIVMHLIASNILSAMQYAVSVPGTYTGQWQLGERFCDLYLLLQSLIGGSIICTHSLIAVNRAWAIVYPVHYRSANTKRASALQLILMWVFIVSVNFPYFMVAGVIKRMPVDRIGCRFNFNVLPAYGTVSAITVYFCPTLLVLALFFVVSLRKLIAGRTVKRCEPANNNTLRSVGPVASVGLVHKAQERPRKYFFLSLLTACVTVLFLPRTMFIILTLFPWRSTVWQSEYFMVTSLLYACEIVVDPILFLMTLDRLRKSTRDLVTKCQ
ncbi:hypothetical protein BV898_08372 [Hypsibius exemplaris]|uniref:G-protein coupled receptors family 1 profile domain-containing protein n=1 Tax=Hypsibius exemplaris TaxID=2072580 RepID=A0A1W0WR26_HYPEX|nr:hypothetical protein BV898_08372 [Hypsibius exemplaris]